MLSSRSTTKNLATSSIAIILSICDYLKVMGQSASSSHVRRPIFGGNRLSGVIVRQLFDKETSTFTYLVSDPKSGLGVIIDPVLEQADRDMKLAAELGITLKYALNTHVHADHITSTGILKKKIPGLQSVLGKSGNEKAVADVKLENGAKLDVGAISLQNRHNPGHTAGCHSLVLFEGSIPLGVFTGDALLIRGCGR